MYTITNCIITVQHLGSAKIASNILIHTCLLHIVAECAHLVSIVTVNISVSDVAIP